jgi:hypothetical protein
MSGKRHWIFGVVLCCCLVSPVQVRAGVTTDGFMVAAAFLTNLSIHEGGHYIIAEQADARGNQIRFFTGENGNFFFGLSTVEEIDTRTQLSYNLAGEVASSYTFEWALKDYRENRSTFNQALLFFSGTDFLWYSLYAFYLSPHQSAMFDPVGIANDTGLHPNVIFGIALTQASLNALRVSTGRDLFIPYFTLDRYEAGFGVRVPF